MLLVLVVSLPWAGCQHGGSLGNLGGAGADELGELEALSVPGFPHQVEVYSVRDAKRAMVILHGGGGRNWETAGALGLNANFGPPSQDSIPWGWLEEHELTVVFPQGFAVEAAPLAYTWDNYVMASGVDDVAFLTELSAQLREEYGVSEVYLLGHSNGGMMANRFWCEAPDVFDAYIGISGPASVHFAGGIDCEPEPAPPYLGIIGDADEVLQVGSENFEAEIWEVEPTLVALSAPAFVDARLLGELQQHDHRSQVLCGQSIALADEGEHRTIFSNCSGRIRLERVHGGGHLLPDIESAGDFRVMDAVVEFIDALRP